MNETASVLPEYPVAMAMNGIDPTLGLQLMSEIGDVTRFTNRGALTAFAGANKFLRVYYGRVKEYLSSLPETSTGES